MKTGVRGCMALNSVQLSRANVKAGTDVLALRWGYVTTGEMPSKGSVKGRAAGISGFKVPVTWRFIKTQ